MFTYWLSVTTEGTLNKANVILHVTRKPYRFQTVPPKRPSKGQALIHCYYRRKHNFVYTR
jgi:hypothetical protein